MWWVMALAGTGAILALTALVLALRQAFVWAVAATLRAMFVFLPTLTAGVAPRLNEIWVMKTSSRWSRRRRLSPGDPPLALAGYQEPSMLFALGEDVVLADGAGAADTGAASGGLALVEDAELGDFLARLAELQADAARSADLRELQPARAGARCM